MVSIKREHFEEKRLLVQKTNALIGAVAKVLSLGSSEIDPADSFFSIGGDSLAALMVTEELADIGFQLKLADLLNNDSLSRVALGMREATR